MTTQKDTAGIIERLKWPESCPEIKRRLHDIANGITLRECADSDAHFLHDLADNLPAIAQALTESSAQMDPEAAAILCTLGCVPDSTDLSETDAKVSVGFLRRLIEGSGQGTDRAEAMWEKAEPQIRYCRCHSKYLAGCACFTPVSADGRLDHRADCQLYTVPTYGLCTCDFDQRKAAQIKSKQPSDTTPVCSTYHSRAVGVACSNCGHLKEAHKQPDTGAGK